VLEGLPGNDNVDRVGIDLAPPVGITQDNVDILAGDEIDAKIAPGWNCEKLAIGTVQVGAAQVDNGERFVAPGIEVPAAKFRHAIERVPMHRFANKLVRGISQRRANQAIKTAPLQSPPGPAPIRD
jgi:hypothetical protein